VARVVLCLIITDALIVAIVRLQWETSASLTSRRQLHVMCDSGQEYDVQTMNFVESTNLRLREANVRFRGVGMWKLPGGQELKSVVEGYPMPVHYRLAAPDSTAPVPPSP